MENVVQAAMVGAAKQMEEELDTEIARLDNLQDDDYETLRKRRLAQLRKGAEDRARWQRNGHGTVAELPEKEFFGRAKGSERMVVIFFRKGTSRYTEDVNDHMARVAERHFETFFAKVDAEKAAFLCTKLRIRVMPSIVLVKGGEIERVVAGLDAFAEGGGKFSTVGIERRLFEMGMLTDCSIGDDG